MIQGECARAFWDLSKCFIYLFIFVVFSLHFLQFCVYHYQIKQRCYLAFHIYEKQFHLIISLVIDILNVADCLCPIDILEVGMSQAIPKEEFGVDWNTLISLRRRYRHFGNTQYPIIASQIFPQPQIILVCRLTPSE